MPRRIALRLLLLLHPLFGGFRHDLASAERRARRDIRIRTRTRRTRTNTTTTTTTKHELAPRPASVIIRDLLAGLVGLAVANAVPAALPVGPRDLALDLVAQVPEVPIVRAVDVVRELVAEGVADGLVVAVAVVGVGAQAQLDDLAAVAVQAQDARRPFVAGLGVGERVHLRQQADGEPVRAHRGADARVRPQPLEEGERALRARQVRQRPQRHEGVLALLLRAQRVAPGEGLRGVPARRGEVGLPGCGFLGRGVEGGDLGARGAEEGDLLVLQVGDGPRGEGGLEHSQLGHHELLVVDGDVQRILDLVD